MNHMDDFVRNTKVSSTDLLHVCLFKNCLCDTGSLGACFRFYTRDDMLARVYWLWLCVCVCLSVCMSVTSQSFIETDERIALIFGK